MVKYTFTSKSCFCIHKTAWIFFNPLVAGEKFGLFCLSFYIALPQFNMTLVQRYGYKTVPLKQMVPSLWTLSAFIIMLRSNLNMYLLTIKLNKNTMLITSTTNDYKFTSITNMQLFTLLYLYIFYWYVLLILPTTQN